ncbi:MAG: hypothetical protein GX174_14945, partial [Lentisphaerae bacterium]|nr:hypothetical protein [Lentisphaerota bacterium]
MSGLPANWKRVSLAESIDIDTRQVLPSESPATQFNYIALENIESGTGQLINLRPVQGATILSGKFRFDSSHVLFGKLRPYLNKVVLPDRAGICSTDILPLKPQKASLSREWLALCLRSPHFIEYSRTKMDGAKMPRLRTPDLQSYEIPVPPLAEQRRIVARIEKLTRRAEEARKLAADRETELDALLQALYSRMIEGVEWKTLVSIRSVVEEKETWNSRQDPRGQVEYLEISGIDNSLGRVIKTKTIPTSNPPSRAKKLIRVGDIVFGTTRPYLKNIAVIPENLDNQVCSTGFCVLRPQTDKVLTEWLFAICRSDLVVEQVTPGQEKHAYPAVSDDAVLDSFIPLPDVSEQRRIVARIEKLTRRVEKVRKLIAEAESQILQFQSALLAKAFRGEL